MMGIGVVEDVSCGSGDGPEIGNREDKAVVYFSQLEKIEHDEYEQGHMGERRELVRVRVEGRRGPVGRSRPEPERYQRDRKMN